MSAKKTATKQPPRAGKPAKPAKGKAFAEKMAAARQAKEQARLEGPCPKGGRHEFALDDDGDNVSTKCPEPGPKPKPGMPKPSGQALERGNIVEVAIPGNPLDGAMAKIERVLDAGGWSLKLLEDRGAFPRRKLVTVGPGECRLAKKNGAQPPQRPEKTPAATSASQGKRAPQPAGEKQLSALDAAAQVLAETGEALNTRQLIEAMAARGLWTSPGGKTPWATLYSAILRELVTDGDAARFVKTERGKFALRQQ